MDKNHQDFDKENLQHTKKIPDLKQNELHSQAPNRKQNNNMSIDDEKASHQALSKEPKTRKLTKSRIAVNVIVAMLSVVLIVVGAGCFYVDGMLNKMNFVPNTESEVTPSIAVSETGETTSLPDPMFVNGLYHDDAITNILILNLDDYQEGDVGRSDSMIMLSIDTRHKKLKMTSFMRDMFVQIPGVGSNRLNTAFTYGGAPLTVKTIENNFGVDIDRYVLIDYDAFETIIDSVGGVYIDVSDEEAVYINEYSFRTDVVGGYQLLNGDLARSYARIRKIGDDFERTARQREVMSAAINQLKTADIGTINHVLSTVLPMITTNLSKTEVLNLASNALTYLNYPVEQLRLPEDGAYSNAMVMIGGMEASVLRPDLEANSESLVQFIYEDDTPEMTQ